MNRRMKQQIRLWIYLFITVLSFLYGILVDKHSILAFIIFIISLPLPYFEFCNKCSKLVWWERPLSPSIFWIGHRCRNESEAK